MKKVWLIDGWLLDGHDTLPPQVMQVSILGHPGSSFSYFPVVCSFLSWSVRVYAACLSTSPCIFRLCLLSVCLSLTVCLFVSLCMSVFVSVPIWLWLLVEVSVCLCIWLTVFCPSVFLPLCLAIYFCIYLYVSICLSILCLSATILSMPVQLYLPTCLPVSHCDCLLMYVFPSDCIC